MFEPWFHEIARQRHQDLLARADRDRLGRMVGEPNAHRRSASYWVKLLLGWAVRTSRLRARFEHSSRRNGRRALGDLWQPVDVVEEAELALLEERLRWPRDPCELGALSSRIRRPPHSELPAKFSRAMSMRVPRRSSSRMNSRPRGGTKPCGTS